MPFGNPSPDDPSGPRRRWLTLLALVAFLTAVGTMNAAFVFYRILLVDRHQRSQDAVMEELQGGHRHIMEALDRIEKQRGR